MSKSSCEATESVEGAILRMERAELIGDRRGDYGGFR